MARNGDIRLSITGLSRIAQEVPLPTIAKTMKLSMLQMSLDAAIEGPYAASQPSDAMEVLPT